MLSAERGKLETKLSRSRDAFLAKLGAVEEAVAGFATRSELRSLWEHVETLTGLKAAMDAAERSVEELHEEEERLGWPRTPFAASPASSITFCDRSVVSPISGTLSDCLRASRRKRALSSSLV